MSENKEIRYATILNDSENIGDDIQALAATRFYPRKNPTYLLRDKLLIKNVKTDSKVILNGWWGDGTSNILIPNSKLDRLLTSVHINESQKIIYARKKWIGEFKKYNSIGARDLDTLDYLQGLGVNSHFSGCLTLTFVPNKNIQRNNKVLSIDLSNEGNHFLKSKYGNGVDFISQTISPHLTGLDRLEYAKYMLYLYSSYSLVITSRLHVTLPCLALNTPVLLVRDDLDYIARFSGLYELSTHCNEEELISEKIDLAKVRNSDEYLNLKSKLEEDVESFTGYKLDKSLIPDSIDSIALYSLLNMNNQRYNVLKKFFLKRFNYKYLITLIRRRLHQGTK